MRKQAAARKGESATNGYKGWQAMRAKKAACAKREAV